MNTNPLVTRNEKTNAHNRATKIIRDLQHELFPYYKINSQLVGSARYNAIIKDIRGVFDMDFQLILTNNCQCETFDADVIRKDFLKAFNIIKNHNEKVENSTSVITVRVSDSVDKFNADYEIYSFDFAIIIECNDGSYITKRDSNNHYVWNILPSKNSYIYEKFYALAKNEQKQIIEKVIARKLLEKKKPKNLRIPSSTIFMQEVNNYRR